MGSVCCRPTRPPTATGSVNGCSNTADELHCCSTEGFSASPVSQQRETRSNAPANAFQVDRNSLSSSSRGSRKSGRFTGHQHTPSDSFFSSDCISRSHWESLVSSGSGNFADLITAAGETSSSPSVTFISHKESVLNAGNSPLSSTPESYTSCKQDGRQQLEELSYNSSLQHVEFDPPSSRVSYPPSFQRHSTDKAFYPNESGNNNFCSRDGSMHSFRWPRNKGINSNLGLVDNTCDWWSMQTFSELVASSHKERLRWIRARSPSDFDYVLHRKSMAKAENYSVEIIRANFSEAVPIVSCAETRSCGLCSQLLSESSSTNSHRMVAMNDFTVVGVLPCGHVFHSHCLEEVTPEARKQDPPCPQCDSAAKLKTRNVVEPLISFPSGRMAGSFHGQTSSRNKLSRIVAADNLSEQEFHSRSLKSKGILPVNGDIIEEKSESCSLVGHNEKVTRKLLSRRTFSFKGKTIKDVLTGDGAKNKSATSSQVFSDKSSGEDIFTVANPSKSKSGSFRLLQSR